MTYQVKGAIVATLPKQKRVSHHHCMLWVDPLNFENLAKTRPPNLEGRADLP